MRKRTVFSEKVEIPLGFYISHERASTKVMTAGKEQPWCMMIFLEQCTFILSLPVSQNFSELSDCEDTERLQGEELSQRCFFFRI